MGRLGRCGRADDLLEFTRRLIELRQEHPVFRRRRFFQGRSHRGSHKGDIAWIKPDGAEMTDEDWAAGFAKSIAMFLNGDALPDPGPRGERIVDDSFLLLFNAQHEPLEFTLPDEEWAEQWEVVLDTAKPADEAITDLGEGERAKAGDPVLVEGRSVVLLRQTG